MDAVSTDNNKSIAGIWVKCLFIVLFLYPIYKDTLGSFQIVWAISCMAGLILAAKSFSFDIKLNVSRVCWLIIGALALGSFVTNPQGAALGQTALVTFLMALILAFVLNWKIFDANWVLRIVMYMLAPHAVATIVFWAFPQIYSWTVRSWFFSTARDAIGYQSGLTSHYSFNGMLLAVGFLLAASFVLSAYIKTNSTKSSPKTVDLILLVLFALALMATTKRGPIIFSLVAIACVFLIMERNSKTSKLLIFVVGLLALFGFVLIASMVAPGSSSSLLDRFTVDSDASFTDISSGRDLLWAKAIELWGNSPLLGNGWGTYRYYWGDNVTIFAHNIYLNLLAEVGITGFGVFLLAVIPVFRSSIRVLRVSRSFSSYTAPVAIFCVAFQVYFFLYGLVGGPLYDVENYAFYFVLACSMSYAGKDACCGEKLGESWFAKWGKRENEVICCNSGI